jgi:chemosensory pili system protein ChpA (sensor histidine kinase/response regulator)
VNADADPDGMDAVPTGAVAIVTAPLEDAPLAPEVTSTEPPVSPVAAAVLPADNVTPPPTPELVDPTRREMGPAAPPAATPVARVKAPLPPPPAAPVLKKTAPVEPNVPVEPDVN